MNNSDNFKPGFRLSELDVGILLLGFTAAVPLGKQFEPLGVAVLFTVTHFFLFCNVLRMHRVLEIIWAVSFVSLWLFSFQVGFFTWGQTYLLIFGVTVVVSIIQVLLPSYHGVLWRIFNPKLPEWWEQHS